MPDLDYIDRDAEVKIVGQDSTGTRLNYVSADINGNLFTKDYSNGPVSPGTAASSSLLIGGQFNTALPTLTNAQQAAVQLDSSGRLLIGSIASALPAGANNIGSVNQGTSPWVVSGTVAATQSGTWNITNISGTVSLPTGAATSALQTTGNTSLSTIVTNTTGLVVAQGSATSGQSGQLTMGAVTTAAPAYTTGQTSPFSLTTSGLLRVDASGTVQPVSQSGTWNIGTLTSITNPVAVTGTFWQTTQPVSGTVAVTQSTSPWVVSGTVTATNPSVSTTGTTPPASATYIGGSVTTAAPSYTTGQMNALSLTTAGLLRVDGSGVTQPVSGTVAATQSGAWSTGRTWTLASGTDSVSAVQSGTWNITNITGTVSLPTGAATSALQTTGNTSLSTIVTNTTGLIVAQGSTTSGQSGQLTMGAVTTAAPTYTTGQTSPFSLTTSGLLRVDASGTVQPVSQSGTWNITNISGTISLPTGAATSALQTTGNTSLSTIATNTTRLAQASTTSGQTGNLIMGAVTTNPPSYTTAQTDPASLTITGDLRVADVVNTNGQYRAQSVTTSAAEALGGATILANRKMLSITPTNGTVYWGYSNAVTTSTGSPIFKNQTMTFAVGANVHIYVIAGSTTDCRIAEGS